MERSNKLASAFVKGHARYRAARGGKITIVTMFAILGLIVMAGFVGNAGHVVKTKVATQNAADAITFSSAQWMARGMNAVTATNHLLGEATGLVVVIEALGGPEVDQHLDDYPNEVKTLDKANQVLAKVAPINGLPTYGVTPFLTQADSQFLDKVVNEIVSPDDDRKTFRAFATIYDAKFTLKQKTAGYLLAKSIANIALFIPPPFGYPTAPVALAVHIVADLKLVQISVEYIMLEGLQVAAIAISPIKLAFEKTAVPALAAHGDFIAGRSGNQKSPAGGSVVNAAVADELKRLGDVYHVDAALFPAATDLRLPIEAEPAPSMQGTQQNEPEWGSDEFVAIKQEDIVGNLPGQIGDRTQDVKDRIQAYQDGIKMLAGLDGKIDQQLAKGNELSPEERAKFQTEKQEIAKSRTEKQKRIDELTEQLKKVQNQQDQVDAAVRNAPAMPDSTGNMSARDEHLAKSTMRQSEERYTQWVRATYPYVDSFRAPVLSQFESLLSESKAAEYFRKWSDRYTLTNAWKFRSGFRFQGTDQHHGRWLKSENPLQMYVMKDAFAKSGARRDQKGHEPWTPDSAEGKQQAEQLFTLIGITQRDLKPLFSPRVYPSATDDGITTFAQAVFYNANEQKPDPIGAKSTTQAQVGWDTLNWDPATPAPEWGATPHKSAAKWPWELFDTDAVFTATAGVRLNWQAKLMPVTESRFGQAAGSSLTNSKMSGNMTKARPFFKQMVTH